MAAHAIPRRRTISVLATAVVAGVVAGIGAASERLPVAVVAPVMMLLLAAIDIIGAIVAKAWSGYPAPGLFLLGSALFVLLFWLYGVSLRYGHLSTITIGWVVLVTVGSIALDALFYGAHLPIQKWLAALAVVGLLIYLMTEDGTAHGAGPHAADAHNGAGRHTVAPVDDLRS